LRSRDVARRIALDLYALAAEEKTAEALERELREIAASAETRTEGTIVDTAFPGASEGFRHLMGLVIRDLVLGEFLSVRAEAEGVVRVRVVTAQALSREERQRIVEKLDRTLGVRVKLEESVDPAVLAGARLEIEGRTLDGTLKARLEKLHRTLRRSGEA
jgi:F-type H+-transporting ATPase subunit delta